MTEWKYFQYCGDRPESLMQFDPTQREELETLVAAQVAHLLGTFGIIEDAELDEGASPDIDEYVTYLTLRAPIEEIALEDDSSMTIGQLPHMKDTWITQAGFHAVIHEDEDGVTLHEFVVHDPSQKSEHFVYNSDGSLVDIDILQELMELLGCLTQDWLTMFPLNNPAHDTSSYPRQKSDPVFDAIIADLG